MYSPIGGQDLFLSFVMDALVRDVFIGNGQGVRYQQETRGLDKSSPYLLENVYHLLVYFAVGGQDLFQMDIEWSAGEIRHLAAGLCN